MSLIKELEQDIKKIIKNVGYDLDNLVLQISSRPDLGQYQINDSMQLAKKYGKNPRAIAEEIVNELEKDPRFTNLNIAGPGFINITLTNEYLSSLLSKINDDIEKNIDKQEAKTIIIDYGGANVAKALHVGHLRSADIGEAIKRLAKLLGHKVIGDAHLGDYGRPLGLVVLEIKKRYPNLEYFNENYTGDYSELDLPITNKDLEEIYPLASSKAKEDEIYLEEAREVTYKIQHHVPGYYDIWKKVIEISKRDIKKVYDELNVEFELWYGESDAAEYFDELKEIIDKEDILEDSNGAKIINVATEEDNSPMPPLLFIKSNGTISYETTDIATILQRKKEQNPDEIWYFTDARQSLHFEQVFRATRKARIVGDNVKLLNYGFGTMNGPDGKPFKTRDGGVMPLKTLIEEVNNETLKRLNENIPEAERNTISRQIAIATIKYADFLPFRGTDFVFDVEKFADLEGKTGPYLLYSTIRMKSLLNKAEGLSQDKISILSSELEKDLAITILNMPNVLTRSLESKSLNEIAEYLYKLTSQYNSFYAENRILSEENEQKRESWLVLTKIIYNINSLLLNTLGISIPEKM